MKCLYILILTTLCFSVHQETYAEIRNGYANDLIIVEKKLRIFNEFGQGFLRNDQRKKLEKLLKTTHTKAEKLKENYAKTQNLLEDLRMIAPSLYNEINTIKDHEGNDTHVYVKVVKDLGPYFLGINNVAQSTSNPHVYTSEYGDHSVSVMVIYPSAFKALKILVHELGHVRYQVPHLASYSAYHRRVYQSPSFKGKAIGHLSTDPSHQSVTETMSFFYKSWKQYYRERKKLTRIRPRKMISQKK